jgi:hypothetical protein
MTDMDQTDIPIEDKDVFQSYLQSAIDSLTLASPDYESAKFYMESFRDAVEPYSDPAFSEIERKHFVSWSDAVIAVLNQLYK